LIAFEFQMAAKLSDLAAGFRPEISCPGIVSIATSIRARLSGFQIPVWAKTYSRNIHLAPTYPANKWLLGVFVVGKVAGA
jgi:hypothetical protein